MKPFLRTYEVRRFIDFYTGFSLDLIKIMMSLKDKTFLILPSISGILLFLSFPAFNLSILAWISLIPLLITLDRADLGKKRAFMAGFIFGLIYFTGTLYWIYHSIHYYGNLNLILSFICVILLCAYLSLYTGIFSSLYHLIIKNTTLPSILVAPSIWVTMEYLRGKLFTGFPWALVGYSQYKFLYLIQISDITGVYGVSFFVIAFSSLIVDIIQIKRRTDEIPLYPIHTRIIGIIMFIIISAGIFVYGYWRVKQVRLGKDIKISIIQGNIEQDKKWEPQFQKEVISIYEDLTKTEVMKNSPQLVVWPETAVPFLFSEVPSNPPSNDDFLSQSLIYFQKELNTYLLFGGIRRYTEKVDGLTRTNFSNSAFLLNNDGKLVYFYDKIHLVPFGEYVPLRSILFFIDKLTVGIGDYKAGREQKVATTPQGSFGVVICYEIIFPELVRKFFNKEGDFIVNITNDAWFGKTSGPYQHFSTAIFRAVENRKPVVRAANTGISGFIDSNGRIILTSALFERKAMTMSIKGDKTVSFYTGYGDIFTYICILISILCLSRITRL